MMCKFLHLAYFTADGSPLPAPPTRGFHVQMFSSMTVTGISAPSGPRGRELAPQAHRPGPWTLRACGARRVVAPWKSAPRPGNSCISFQVTRESHSGSCPDGKQIKISNRLSRSIIPDTQSSRTKINMTARRMLRDEPEIHKPFVVYARISSDADGPGQRREGLHFVKIKCRHRCF